MRASIALWAVLVVPAACTGGGDSMASIGTGGTSGSGEDTGTGEVGSGSGGTGERSCWTDPETGSTWEYPAQGLPPLLAWQEAIDYCAEVSACGHSDWRLPNIDELRTLLRGCSGTVTGGACPVHDGSTASDFTADCFCSDFGGPGPGGCFWPDEFGDTCGIGGWNYWSSSAIGDNAGSAWSVAFHVGRVAPGFKTDAFRPRCLR